MNDSLTLVPDPTIPLNSREIEDLFASLDWRIVLRDSLARHSHVRYSAHGVKGEFHLISMFRALLLPFLTKIPSETALEKALREKPELCRICMFSPKVTPTRTHFWRFRDQHALFYSRVMLKLLIDMVICDTRPNLSLPFVLQAFPIESIPTTEINLEWRIENLEDIRASTPYVLSDIVTRGKTFIDIAREIDERQDYTKPGLSSKLALPAVVRVPHSAGETIKFVVGRPYWLDTPLSRKLYGTDPISHHESIRDQRDTYVTCNVLLVRKFGGNKYVLLSQRHSGFGRGYYTLPGGKQLGNESLESCVKRELREETGLSSEESIPISFYRMKVEGRPQVISIAALVSKYKGIVSTREPDENGEWKWYRIEDLPKPLFEPTARAIEDYVQKRFRRMTWSDLEVQVRVEKKLGGNPESVPIQGLLFNGDLN